MNIVRSLKKYLMNPQYRWMVNDAHGLYNTMPDDEYLIRKFKIRMGKELDLENPKTMNEKLQWLKLYDRKSLYTDMVDKYEAKRIVSAKIGEEYVIPTIGVWNHAKDINFDDLPEQFVLKCTHDSHSLVICKEKSSLDDKKAVRQLDNSLKKNYYYKFREWPYKNVTPRILAEEYLEDAQQAEKPLNDYKIYTFNGKARICMINQDRGIHTRADYFDRDYNWLDISWGYDHADIPPVKPLNYELMFMLAEELSIGIPELRVDFYNINGRVYFGEMTFFDGSGFDKITPAEWDLKMGEWIQLPHKIKEGVAF